MKTHSLQKTGTLYGVGVGPGDPELLTMKAWRLIRQAPVVSYLCNDSGESQARQIAAVALSEAELGALELALPMPMSRDRTAANAAYDEGAARIAEQLRQGHDVVFLCEGDPLFFGSFAYLLDRLQDQFPCEVVPGISSVNAAASALCSPLTLLTESFVVVSGRHTDEQIIQALQTHQSVVIMKAGQARARILALLERTSRIGEARYLEYIGRDNQRIVEDVRRLSAEAGPYFSLFVVLPARVSRP